MPGCACCSRGWVNGRWVGLHWLRHGRPAFMSGGNARKSTGKQFPLSGNRVVTVNQVSFSGIPSAPTSLLVCDLDNGSGIPEHHLSPVLNVMGTCGCQELAIGTEGQSSDLCFVAREGQD